MCVYIYIYIYVHIYANMYMSHGAGVLSASSSSWLTPKRTQAQGKASRSFSGSLRSSPLHWL